MTRQDKAKAVFDALIPDPCVACGRSRDTESGIHYSADREAVCRRCYHEWQKKYYPDSAQMWHP